MKKKNLLSILTFGLALFLALALFSSQEAKGVGVEVKQDISLNTTGGAQFGAGTAVVALAWTGWIQVNDKRSLAFDLVYVDADGAITEMLMRCETSMDNTTANDAGEDLHAVAIACAGAPTVCAATSGTLTWNNDIPAVDESWTWTISNIPAPFINCGFIGTNAGADDTLTVFARGISP